MDFKKTLIASTAIVAVGGISMATADAAKKPKLEISGFYELFMGVADGDRPGATASGTPTYGRTSEGTFSIVHYGEIRFKASGKTDSGMKWGVYFEDVAGNDAGDEGKKVGSDEASIWLSGSWGKLILGGEDGAHDKVYVGAEKLLHMSPGTVDVFANTSAVADEKFSSQDTSDDSKITYYTPRVSGFQAGYSWIPNSFEDGNCTAAFFTDVTDAAGTVSTVLEGGFDTDHRGSNGSNSSCDQSAHEGSLEYKGKVGPGKIRATWGFGYLATSNNEQGHEFNWRAGVQYGQGPWTVAAGYRIFDNDGDNIGNDGDTEAWEIGASYSGGRWEVTLHYMEAEYEDSGGDTDYYNVGITGAYNLGAGLTLSASLWAYDLDDSADSSKDTDGTVAAISLGAKF